MIYHPGAKRDAKQKFLLIKANDEVLINMFRSVKYFRKFPILEHTYAYGSSEPFEGGEPDAEIEICMFKFSAI